MNIAEHIAYLIGDSKRVVIPNYPDTPTVPELLDKPDSEQGFGIIGLILENKLLLTLVFCNIFCC